MNRVNYSVSRNRRHKKLLRLSSGYRGRKKIMIRSARIYARKNEKLAYKSRKLLKRDQRRKWIRLIGIWARTQGTKYSDVIGPLLKVYNDRKEIYRTIKLDHESINIEGYKDANIPKVKS
jgi:large subunit ribosomal protein L20